ncbi:MAG: hypothetical protein ACI9R6_000032 [Saprospiraceae bacterium]|jgi:hypothetical protein
MMAGKYYTPLLRKEKGKLVFQKETTFTINKNPLECSRGFYDLK